jgi:hypothetical protein
MRSDNLPFGESSHELASNKYRRTQLAFPVVLMFMLVSLIIAALAVIPIAPGKVFNIADREIQNAITKW